MKIKLEIRGAGNADLLVAGSKTAASICCCMETRYELLPSVTVVQGKVFLGAYFALLVCPPSAFPCFKYGSAVLLADSATSAP